MKKLITSALLCVAALSVNAQYVDLGLPSGTKWKNINETGLYSYDKALENFGESLPTKAQWDELTDYCEWIWTGRGYKVVGLNNKFIFLPTIGAGNEEKYNYGSYWSSSSYAETAAYLYFNSTEIRMNGSKKSAKHSIRIVQTE